MLPTVNLPRLTPTNHREVGPANPRYNCIAWAVEDTSRWWQPGVHWLPADWPANDFGLGALERLFLELGYVDSDGDDSLEPGVLKVALYGSGFLYTPARQLPSGMWTSKLGKGPVIEHDTPEVVAGGLYGDVMQVMKRNTA